MGNLHRSIGTGATALDLPFGGLPITGKYQYQERNVNLCGHHRPNSFAILVPEKGLFSKIFNGNQ